MISPPERGRPVRCRTAIAALRECAAGLEQSACVAVTDDWLSIMRPLSAINGHDAWSVLRDHAAQGGAAALALCARDDTLRLRADVALHADDDCDLAARVRNACAAIAGVSPPPHDPQARGRDAASCAPAGAGLEYLKDLLHEAGWPPLERAGGRITVELEVPGGYFQADARTTGADMRFAVEIVAATDVPCDPARSALAHLLLRTAAAVRLVRPFARESADGAAAGFDVAWTGVPTASEIAHGLAALSVACGLCGREADALLRDAHLASRYLAAQRREMESITNHPAACAAE
jgi:hypothetical protein